MYAYNKENKLKCEWKKPMENSSAKRNKVKEKDSNQVKFLKLSVGYN